MLADAASGNPAAGAWSCLTDRPNPGPRQRVATARRWLRFWRCGERPRLNPRPCPRSPHCVRAGRHPVARRPPRRRRRRWQRLAEKPPAVTKKRRSEVSAFVRLFGPKSVNFLRTSNKTPVPPVAAWADNAAVIRHGGRAWPSRWSRMNCGQRYNRCSRRQNLIPRAAARRCRIGRACAGFSSCSRRPSPGRTFRRRWAAGAG
jgi:hypothetical protein